MPWRSDADPAKANRRLSQKSRTRSGTGAAEGSFIARSGSSFETVRLGHGRRDRVAQISQLNPAWGLMQQSGGLMGFKKFRQKLGTKIPVDLSLPTLRSLYFGLRFLRFALSPQPGQAQGLAP